MNSEYTDEMFGDELIDKVGIETEYYDENSQMEYIEESTAILLLQETKNRIDSLEKKFNKSLQTIETKIEKLLTAFEANVNESINFRQEIKKILKPAQNLKNSSTQTFEHRHNIISVNPFKVVIPCESEEALMELEKQLKENKNVHTEFRLRILCIAGKDVPTFIRRALEAVWTSDIAVNLEQPDGNQKYNQIKDFKIISTIKEVAKAKFKPFTEDELLDTLIKKWFYYASQRVKFNSSLLEKKSTVENKKISDIVKTSNAKQSTPLKINVKEEEEDDEMTEININEEFSKFEDEEFNLDENLENSLKSDLETTESSTTNKSQPHSTSFETVFLKQLEKTNQLKVPVSNQPKKTIENNSNRSKTIFVNKGDSPSVKVSNVVVKLSNLSNHPEILKKLMKTGTVIKKLPTNEMNTQNPIQNVMKIISKSPLTKPETSALKLTTELPVNSEEQLLQVEKWLKEKNNQSIMLAILQSIKEQCSELNVIFTKVFSDSLLKTYSWNGKNNHKSLENLTLSKLMIEAWKEPKQSLDDFEKSIRVCIYRSHTKQMTSGEPKVKKIKLNTQS